MCNILYFLQKYFRAADLSNDKKVTMEEFLTAMDVLPEADHKYVFGIDPVTYSCSCYLH